MQAFNTFIANHLGLTYALAVTLVLLMIVEFLRLKRNNFRVDVKSAVNLINRDNAVVIDLRPADTFKNGHIVDALSLNATDMQTTLQKMVKFKTRPVILVDGNGLESQKIALRMIKEGYNVYVLSGGIRSWQQASLPLVKN